MANPERLTESLEDYLEAIWLLIQEKQVARSKDIADRLGVNKSSVTGALKSLSARGFVHYEAYQFVTLTDEGRRAAADIVRRHEVVRDFLTRLLNIPEDIAEANACRIEHALDGQALEALVRFFEFVLTCPRTGPGWIEAHQGLCRGGPEPDRCRSCLDHCRSELDKAIARLGKSGESRKDLSDMGEGDEARIVDIAPPDAVPDRLRKKGLAVGALVRKEKAKRGEGRVAVKVRGHHVHLDPDQAKAVKIRVVR